MKGEWSSCGIFVFSFVVSIYDRMLVYTRTWKHPCSKRYKHIRLEKKSTSNLWHLLGLFSSTNTLFYNNLYAGSHFFVCNVLAPICWRNLYDLACWSYYFQQARKQRYKETSFLIVKHFLRQQLQVALLLVLVVQHALVEPFWG